MKCIKAIVRPEREGEVTRRLEEAGIFAMTKWDVLGRGRQRGIQVGGSVYHELPKICLVLVVDEAQASAAIDAIMAGARTGNPGDGRIFVSNVKEVYTIRTGKQDGV
ncbi:MAG: P-II family nitrogen regulator [Candidatus Omnitrophica bacterium]|nr:P-II family nitrogen regulator [Candidatus Omnitrophota bacterium]